MKGGKFQIVLHKLLDLEQFAMILGIKKNTLRDTKDSTTEWAVLTNMGVFFMEIKDHLIVSKSDEDPIVFEDELITDIIWVCQGDEESETLLINFNMPSMMEEDEVGSN